MKVALTSDLHYGYASNSTNKIIKMLKNLQKEEVDVLIVAGDSATVAQYQFKRCMETLREYLDMPIYYVRGNHDIWNGFHKKDKSHNLKSLDQIYNYHDKICDPINIIHLDKGPIQLDSGRVELYGFDGWYGSNTPETNDFKWIPTEYKNQPSNVYLANKTWQDFNKVLELANKSEAEKKILVTHHNIYVDPKYGINSHNGVLQFYSKTRDTFDILCCGHTHEYQNYTDNNLLVLNSGSDYNNPKYLIFEV